MADHETQFSRQYRLLLVDDEPHILTSLSRLLEEEPDLEVFTETSPVQALQLLEIQPVDLVISDMRMPVMDGATFLTKLTESWPDTARILLTGFSDMESTIRAINEGKVSHYITKPWEEEDLLKRIREALEVKHLREHNQHLLKVSEARRKKLEQLTNQQESIIKSRTSELEQTASQLDLAYQELQESYFQSVPLLGHLIDMHERHKKNHAKRVADITRILATNMGASDHELRQYYIGALLHDIGKIGIEQVVLGKSSAEMNNNELKRYRQHTILGESALLSFDPMREAAQIVRCHHERYDGKGFPGKLIGEAIPLGARVVAIANDYDNLLLPNNFLGHALSEHQAHEFIMGEAGKRYDPILVDLFDRCVDQVRELMQGDKQVLLSLDKVTPGMVLSQDLINHHGIVMLAAGRVLTEAHIKKLQQFEVAFDTLLKIPVKFVEHQDEDEQQTG